MVKLELHGTSFPRSILVAFSRGCHEDVRRKTVPWNLSFTEDGLCFRSSCKCCTGNRGLGLLFCMFINVREHICWSLSSSCEYFLLVCIVFLCLYQWYYYATLSLSFHLFTFLLHFFCFLFFRINISRHFV